MNHRLPEVKTLYEILPKGTEGGKEFARIVDLLLFQEARRAGKNLTLFSDAAGDYHGLDSFENNGFRQDSTTGYQYKFYPSPLSADHRQSIIQSLEKTAETQEQFKLKKWILVTPQDLTESTTRKDGGDVSWFESLHDKLDLKFELEHWGHRKLIHFFLNTPTLCLFYYPGLVSNGINRKKTIEDIRRRYDNNLPNLYREIHFVGMPIYKQEAARGVPMEHIYIPLSVIPDTQSEQDAYISYINPLSFLMPGSQHVLLGDPGSGKSTLLRFLALSGSSKPLQERYDASPDKRLPILVILRRYADELKSHRNLSLIDYVKESIQADFNLKDADLDFLEYYLETGQTLLLFDGLDELPSSHFKQIIRDRILTLTTTYPGNTTIVTSRIVGYDNPFQFDKKDFVHYRVAKLRLPEMKQFVKDWYCARIENERERETNVNDLIRILDEKNHAAIRELAENPLLLTIIALVHRIDAVLPDERVVLYQKCTETLLNTWHTGKFRDHETKNKSRVERRNRHRIEAIANWMHCQGGGTEKTQRAVVPYRDLREFLITYITKVEKIVDPDKDPEDIAEEFIFFAKREAGLLIELGDNQYSFVHLTFQEYLTSSHIITMGEKGGISNIWETVKDRSNDPRWHEVIRLIVAGLKNDESQQFIIDQLLSRKEINSSIAETHILGGLLLDGIEAAEVHKKEIVKSLFHVGSIANNAEHLRRVSYLLQALKAKESIGEEFFCSILYSLWETIVDEKQRVALILVGSITGISEINFFNLTQDLLIKDMREADLLKLLLLENSQVEKINSLAENIELLWAVQDALLFTSRSGNFIASAFQAITSSLEPSIAAERFFKEQLITLYMGLPSLPFNNFNVNSLRIGGGNKLYSKLTQTKDLFAHLSQILDLPLNETLDRNRAGILSRTIDQVLNWDQNRNRDQAIKRVQDRARHLVRVLAMDLHQVINQDQVLDFVLALVFLWNGSLVHKTEKGIWQNVILMPSFYNTILDILCQVFNLKPETQWREALRVGFLPTVPRRVILFNPTEWIQVEESFVYNRVSKTDVYNAAWQLLFDSWLYIWGYYNSPDETIFGRLADLTRTVDAAPLRIAHCIRDLAYGDGTRTEELVTMVKSEDPEYRSIFEACYWRVTPEEEAKIKKPKKRVKKKQ